MWPTFVMFLVVFTTGCLKDYAIYDSINIYFMFGWIIAALIYELFAYMTCWVFVLRKGRSNDMVWLNYTIWFLIPALSNISNIIGL